MKVLVVGALKSLDVAVYSQKDSRRPEESFQMTQIVGSGMQRDFLGFFRR